ncbi:MAG: amidohydrolase family protein, partial [Saprospiraceae bacterium]|nr:amidohydrolase family protein [Saprospiraceae bacterium]
NAAYVMRQEQKVGSIEVGKEADLIVLDQNIFEIPANQINGTKVDLTYLKGKVVFER